MTLLLFSIFCFVFASFYTSTTAQDVEVCVSYPNVQSTDLVINVNWTFPDEEVNITFEDRSGITNGLYDNDSAVGIPFALNTGQRTVNVTVCRLNNTLSCNSVVAATTPIYNATWRRVDNTTLEFTCELACRTPAITGCNVNLIDTSNSGNTLSEFSTIISGTNEAISSRFATVIVNNVDPTTEYSYTATPIAIINGESVSFNGIQDIIPAAIQVSNTISSTLTSSVTTSLMLDTSSADMSTTTSSTTPTSIPISSSITAMPSNTVTAGAVDDDDDDDDGYLPVIIAASCACVLLLVVAIILLIIIIRVKRRGSSSNLSSPSASKINNYDDLGDVKYFPMLDSQNNVQKSQSLPDDIQNQESHIKKAPEYEFPVFTSVEQNPQVAASYDLLSANDDKYDSPDAVLNSKPQSNDPPVDPLYDPVILESAAQPDGSKSPVAQYDKLMHSPTPQAISHFPPSIYDTLSEKNLRDHYEFPDRKDENGMVESNTELKRVVTGNGDEYTVPQSS